MNLVNPCLLICCWTAGFLVPLIAADTIAEYVENFKAFTVATNETDGFRQFIRSAKIYNVPVEVVGFGTKWAGGDMHGPGGGFKVNLLKEALKSCKNDAERIIMFTDSYDVLFLSDISNIVRKFLSFNARIVFSAEAWIWPDNRLVDKYPEVKNGYRFLNSGGFIGFCDSIYAMLDSRDSLENTDDDQLFYTNIFLDEQSRNSFNIKLDQKAEIFQNLFGAVDDVHLLPVGNKFELSNVKFNTKPCVLHGNGLSKYVDFRTMGNYLADRWSVDKGCKECEESVIKLDGLSIKDYPRVVIAVFINRPTPFFKEFMEKIFRQNYPKRRISLFVHNAVQYHQKELDDLLSHHKEKYADIKLIKDSDMVETVAARHFAVDYCLQKDCDSYLNVDSDAHLDNEETLISLIQQNRSVIAPMMIRPYKAWSNFWGALDKQGYYRRSFDYMDIVNFKRKGLWNVPYISSCYLINATVIKNPELKPTYVDGDLDYDMAFCSDMRKKGVYLYVNNLQDFGHLTDLEGFDTSRTNPNVYELPRNRQDWEQAYLHPEYADNFAPNRTHLQPCTDVFWFPIVSPRFCKEFIEIMENFGQWSDGSNKDTRLQGGYEAVPTRDIHMTQVGLNDQWLEFLRLYVTPLQEMIFIGYHHNPPRSLMNFVVRYKPDEQPSLRPHHDSSTYTINIALNRPHIDYEGGGCRFIRYDCKVINMKLGWMLMHPGRLTHFHEGLLVTEGTRYIMVSFVDP